MNRAAVIVFLAVALVGCTQPRPNTLANFNCVDDRPFGECKIEGTKANPTPQLVKTGNGLQMTPKALCTQASANVTVRIRPPNSSPPGTIIIAAKDLQNAVWLLGTNSDNPDEIKVSIPSTVATGEYDFVVVDTESGHCLDPRWEVQ